MNVKFHSVNQELLAVYEDGRVFVLIEMTPTTLHPPKYGWKPLPDLPV